MIKFLAANWLWILFVVGFIAMHRSGMGCGMGHGGHSGHGRTHRQDTATSDSPVEEDARQPRR